MYRKILSPAFEFGTSCFLDSHWFKSTVSHCITKYEFSPSRTSNIIKSNKALTTCVKMPKHTHSCLSLAKDSKDCWHFPRKMSPLGAKPIFPRARRLVLNHRRWVRSRIEIRFLSQGNTCPTQTSLRTHTFSPVPLLDEYICSTLQ